MQQAPAQRPIQQPTFPAPPPTAAPRKQVTFSDVTAGAGHRIVLYGPGGIGKTTLACQAPGPVAVIDLDDSLGRLKSQLETQGLLANVRVVAGVTDWLSLRDVINSGGWDDIGTIVVDSATRGEESVAPEVLESIPNDKGHKVKRIEDYGFYKGYTHIFDTFLPLLSDLDAHCRAGRHVILSCHECTANVPNPNGEDWIRYEPRLQTSNTGKASIRLRVKEWADHVLFMGYDVAVGKDGKGTGCGSRTIYPAETPACMAKSRTCGEQIPMPADVWAQIIK